MATTTRHPIRYGPKDGIDLWARFIDHKPMDYDFSSGYPEIWDYFEAALCEECNQYVAPIRGSDYHCDVDDETDCEGDIYAEGPMMDFIYPIDICRVGDLEDAALALADLPLCIVEIGDLGRFMALTGGGMDLSWQIVEGYMRFGYLPPTHFSHLPAMAGKRLNSVNKWILGGMRRALLIQQEGFKWSLRDLRQLRKQMAE